MKVVQVNTYDGNGGAGRAALRLNKALNEQGIQSSVLSLYQFNPHSGVTTAFSSLMGKLKAVFNIFAERYLVLPFLKDREIPFSLNSFGYAIAKHPLIQSADVIHLHWINHGFLSPSQIAQLGKLNKKIVWTLHDANPVTGGCHVRYACQHNVDQCGTCPVLQDPGPSDSSHRIWKRKYKYYGSLDLSFIGPSKWISNVAKESSIGRDKKVYTIGNSLEMDIFYPKNKEECRKELGFAPDKKVILAGFMPSKFSRHKGLPELIEALKSLAIAEPDAAQKTEVCFFGASAESLNINLPFQFRFTGTIKDDNLLAKYYSAADVFVMSSLDENLSYTAMEALACGTPVAAFNIGGFSDLVQHQENGYLTSGVDTAALAAGISWILNHPHSEALSSFAREWVVNRYSPSVIASEHIKLYKSL